MDGNLEASTLGLAPLAWKLVNGELPPGIERFPAGVLRGQATAARVQPYKFEVEVRDSSEPPQKSTRWFSLAVRPAPLRIVPASEHLRIMPATEGSSGGSGSARDTVRMDEGAPPDNGSTPPKAAGKPADCSATTITGTPHHWDSSISGTMPEPKPGETIRIELQLDGRSQGVFTPMVDPSQCEFVVLLSHPLFEKQRARVRERLR